MDDLNLSQQNIEPEEKQSLKSKISDFLAMFIPVDGYFVTPILIIANISIYIIMVLSGVHFIMPESQDLVSWGANYRPVTLDGQVWRLLSSCFLHIGVIHLVLNMYALINIGLLLESVMGRNKFLILYLLTGLAASATSLWWHENTVSAGASGAIFGMYGVFVALLTTNLIEKEQRRAHLQSMAIFVGYNLLYGLKGGIDNAAHIGGLLSGVGLGYLSYFALVRPDNNNFQKTILWGSVGLVLIYSAVIFFILPKDMSKYFKALDEFAEFETKALVVYKLPENTSDSVYIFNIIEGIGNWEKAQVLLNEIDKLDLPKNLQDKNELFKSYVDVRLKIYRLINKSLVEKTDQYQDEIEGYNQKIESKITELENFK
jgi:rhomboid protease GluP